MEVEFGAAENTHFYNFLLDGNGSKYLCKKWYNLSYFDDLVLQNQEACRSRGDLWPDGNINLKEVRKYQMKNLIQVTTDRLAHGSQ